MSSEKSFSTDSSSSLQERGAAEGAWLETSKSTCRLREDTTKSKHAAEELPEKVAAGNWNDVGETVKIFIQRS